MFTVWKCAPNNGVAVWKCAPNNGVAEDDLVKRVAEIVTVPNQFVQWFRRNPYWVRTGSHFNGVAFFLMGRHAYPLNEVAEIHNVLAR